MEMSKNQKDLAMISLLSFVVIGGMFYFISLYAGKEPNFFETFSLAILPNFAASFVTFVALYLYFGKDLTENNDATKTMANELKEIKNLQDIGAKLNSSSDNYLQFVLNLEGKEQDTKKLETLKKELADLYDKKNSEFVAMTAKLNEQQSTEERNKLTDVIQKIASETSDIKKRLSTLEKITYSLNVTDLNQNLESKIKVQESQIQKLNDKLRLLEQQKANYESKMKEYEEYKKKAGNAMKMQNALQVFKDVLNDLDLTN